MHVHGDTAAVVLNGDAIVFVDCNFNMRAITSQGFVDRVVHRLVNEVVQTFLADVADVHGRALAYGFQTFQHLNVGGAVIGVVCRYLFHCVLFLIYRYKDTKK